MGLGIECRFDGDQQRDAPAAIVCSREPMPGETLMNGDE